MSLSVLLKHIHHTRPLFVTQLPVSIHDRGTLSLSSVAVKPCGKLVATATTTVHGASGWGTSVRCIDAGQRWVQVYTYLLCMTEHAMTHIQNMYAWSAKHCGIDTGDEALRVNTLGTGQYTIHMYMRYVYM